LKRARRRAKPRRASRVKPPPPPRAASTTAAKPQRRAQRARRFAVRAPRRIVKALRRRWKHTRRAVRRIYNRRYRSTYRSTIARVPSRDELPALLNARGLLGRAAEVGVKTGKYSDYLLHNWCGAELISIDPWRSAAPDEYVDRSNVSQEEFERFYREACALLEPHGSRSSIWRTTSVEAAARVADRSLDFVYIDARHDYESVKEDLEAWCSRVRPGGILAGHDYVDGDFVQGRFRVKAAVDEFFAARDIPVHATEGPSAVELFPSWIVEVPEEGIAPTPAELPGARSPA
jgi:SAM-dependent methyltransferase